MVLVTQQGWSILDNRGTQLTSIFCRQVVALVFNHISLTPEQLQQEVSLPSIQGGALGPESPRDGPEGFDSGSANAALKLLDDLCLMAGGNRLLCNTKRTHREVGL